MGPPPEMSNEKTYKMSSIVKFHQAKVRVARGCDVLTCAGIYTFGNAVSNGKGFSVNIL